MARSPKAIRGKFADEKYLGAEPDLRGSPSRIDLILAYNWYNYFYDNDSAKAFIIAYLKEFATDKSLIKKVNNIDASKLRTIGWNCRILSLGGNLSDDIKTNSMNLLIQLANEAQSTQEPIEDTTSSPINVVSIQERIRNKTNDVIADIECELDKFVMNGENSFHIANFMRTLNIKPQIAQHIADYYKPLYAELFDAIQGKNEDLKEAYSRWKKPKLKAYCEFVRNIVAEAESRAIIIKSIRKPRKKKEKPASVQVAKLKYLEKSDEFNLSSIRAVDIIGANQLWVFNVKYRNLTVYNAMGPAGLGVKGTTITAYDEKTSVTKKLRKPKEQLSKLMDGGKIVLRKFMDEIKCKSKEASGRINTDVILLRSNK